MSETYKLWLDDIRDPAMHGCIGWAWMKDADDAIRLLATGRVVEASLDHDLSINATIGMPCTEKTGYDVVCWMEANNIWPRDGVRVHSMNPSGKQRMEQVIRNAYARRSPASAVKEKP